MIKKAKRYLAGLMSMCMCLTMVPINVQAQVKESENIQSESYYDRMSEKTNADTRLVTINGYCGESGVEPDEDFYSFAFALSDSNHNVIYDPAKYCKVGETYYLQLEYRNYPQNVFNRAEVTGLELSEADKTI